MNSLTHNPFDLALNVSAYIDLIGLADSHKGLVDFGVELGSNVFAVEGHLGSSLGAKVFGELLDMAHARIFNILARDFLEGTRRNPRGRGHRWPIALARRQLIDHVVVN